MSVCVCVSECVYVCVCVLVHSRQVRNSCWQTHCDAKVFSGAPPSLSKYSECQTLFQNDWDSVPVTKFHLQGREQTEDRKLIGYNRCQ